MNKRFLLALGTIALMGTFNSYSAVEYWVATNGDDTNPGTESQPFGSVEQAAFSVLDNEEAIIHLEKDATFRVGKIDLGQNKLVTFIGDNTTLLAADKPGNAGGEGNRILQARSGCKIKVDGLVFKNGRQIEYYGGGGIFFDGESLEVNNCTFVDCESGSGGSAINSHGKYVKVTNSYFKGNYAIGGGARGGAIIQCGKADIEVGGELIVENCTFDGNSLTQGGQGTAIGIYEPALNAQYTTTKRLEVKNCTFVGNYSKDPYQAAIDISDGSECETYIVNNTFYNQDGGLRLYFQTVPVYFINNFVYANKATILSEASIASTERTAITAYNNVLIGAERGVNEGIDDPCLTSEAASCSNTIGLTKDYSMVQIGISAKLKTDNPDSPVPYLPITRANSILVNAGMDDSSEFTNNVNVVPATDVCYAKPVDKKDIGAFEFGGKSGVEGVVASASLFAVKQSASSIEISSLDNSQVAVTVYGVDGKLAYQAAGQTVSVAKSELPKGIVIVRVSNNESVASYKIVVL